MTTKRFSISELEGLLSGTTPGEWNEEKIGTVFRSTSVSGECGRKVLMVEVKDDDGKPHSDSQRKNAVLMVQARNLATELLELKQRVAWMESTNNFDATRLRRLATICALKLLATQRADDNAAIERLKVDCECHRIQAVDRGNSYKKLAAENERLTALCDGYRGERDAAKDEVEKERRAHKISCRAIEILVGDLRNMFNVPQDKELMPVIEETLSALTRARAEGMEEAAKIADKWVGCSGIALIIRDAAKQVNEGAADGR